MFDAATAQSLLAVDPVASGRPSVVLPTSRSTKLYDIDLDPTTTNSPDTDWHTESKWSSLGTTTSSRKVTTDTVKAGLLAFLGVGPEQNQTTMVSISASKLARRGRRDRGHHCGDATDAETRPSSTINAYYDKAFGTIVCQAAP